MAYTGLYYFWLILISSFSSYSPQQRMDASGPTEDTSWPRPPLLRTVGNGNWDIPFSSSSSSPVNYTSWASRLTFYVGDKLEFKYAVSEHNVIRVNLTGFQNCDQKLGLKTYDDGDTIVTLDASGAWYFICGKSNHCRRGQKLVIAVQPIPSSPNPSSGSRMPQISPPIAATLAPSPFSAPLELPLALGSSQIPLMPHPASVGLKTMPTIMFHFLDALILQWLFIYIL